MTTSTLCRECGERFQVKPRAGRDFLLERRAPDGIECIVTNPPYRLADQFVEHGCEHLGRVRSVPPSLVGNGRVSLVWRYAGETAAVDIGRR
jgi:hypothetical protein